MRVSASYMVGSGRNPLELDRRLGAADRPRVVDGSDGAEAFGVVGGPFEDVVELGSQVRTHESMEHRGNLVRRHFFRPTVHVGRNRPRSEELRAVGPPPLMLGQLFSHVAHLGVAEVQFGAVVARHVIFDSL